jgi:hypothetical protein
MIKRILKNQQRQLLKYGGSRYNNNHAFNVFEMLRFPQISLSINRDYSKQHFA